MSRLTIKIPRLLWVGIYMYLLTAYLFASSSIGSILLIFELAIILLADYNARGKAIFCIRIEILYVYLMIFIIASGLSFFVAADKSLAISMLLALLKIFLSTAVIYNAVSTENSIDGLLKTVMAVGYTLVVIAIIYYGPSNVFTMIGAVNARLNNDLINSNTLGMAVAMSIVINLYYILYEKVSMYSILAIPSILIIATSGSRKSLVLLVLGCFLILVLKNSDNKNFIKKFLKLVFVILLIGVVVFFASKLSAFNEINHRMQGLIAVITGVGEVDHSSWLRQQYIEMGLNAFKESPILGIGLDNARLMTRAVYGFDHYLHNNYVELLADTGLLGFCTYYAMYLYCIYNSLKLFKLHDRELYVCITILSLLIIMDYGMVSYYAKETYFYILIIFARISQIKKDKKL